MKPVPQFDYSIFIGRFQPFHKGHLVACQQAFQKSKHLIILVGSAFSAPNIRNPFSFEQRREMISSNLNDAGLQNRFTILPIRDYYYSDNAWVSQVQNTVQTITGTNSNISLIGHKKDSTSYYLDLFPSWTFTEVTGDFIINATDIRNKYLSSPSESPIGDITSKTKEFLDSFSLLKQFKVLSDEYKDMQVYKQAWAAAPYAPTFVTTDAVVTCLGHILLIKRKASPGKGLYALPGGFINQEELLEDGCLRELKEETRIKVPLPVLKGSISGRNVFDHPLRSVRGRTITHAFYIELKDKELPKVKGGDDASSASWELLSWVESNTHLIFEDHSQIISSFTGRGTNNGK